MDNENQLSMRLKWEFAIASKKTQKMQKAQKMKNPLQPLIKKPKSTHSSRAFFLASIVPVSIEWVERVHSKYKFKTFDK